MSKADTVRNRIIDTALALGDEHGWEAVRLHRVATELQMPLDAIRQHFREKEDVVEAWFDRADAAMLKAAEAPDFAPLASRHRLHRLIMAWLDALAPHRKVTRQMILGKLEPGHLHIQIPGLMRVSRTVQWVREAAGRDATFLRRALEETALTSLYLLTFAYWMRDDSADSARTREFLEHRLDQAEQLDRLVFRRAGRSRLPWRRNAEVTPVDTAAGGTPRRDSDPDRAARGTVSAISSNAA